MKRKPSIWAALAVGAAATVTAGGAAADDVSYERVADMLYTVMSADREVYTKMVIQRLTVDDEVITASEHFRDDLALPLPAQMFRFGAEAAMDATEDFSYALLSLDPINKKNGPGTDLEREGLEFVVDNPGENFYGRRSWAARSTSPPSMPTTPSPRLAHCATTITRIPRAPTSRSAT